MSDSTTRTTAATIERKRQWALARTVWLVSFVPGLLIGIVIGAWGL